MRRTTSISTSLESRDELPFLTDHHPPGHESTSDWVHSTSPQSAPQFPFPPPQIEWHFDKTSINTVIITEKLLNEKLATCKFAKNDNYITPYYISYTLDFLKKVNRKWILIFTFLRKWIEWEFEYQGEYSLHLLNIYWIKKWTWGTALMSPKWWNEGSKGFPESNLRDAKARDVKSTRKGSNRFPSLVSASLAPRTPRKHISSRCYRVYVLG